MKVAAFIANRIAFNRSAVPGGQKPFSRFIIRLSVVATVISVAIMIITLSFANGFQETVSQKVFSFLGHIRILEKLPEKAIISEEFPIEKNNDLVTEIQKNPAVAKIHPYSTKYVLLRSKEELDGVILKGLDSTYNFEIIKRFIKKGTPIQFKPGSFSRDVMLSDHTATILQVKNAGDSVMLMFVEPEGGIRPYKVRVSGIFKTGIEEYDKTFAIGDMRLIQRQSLDSTNRETYDDFIGGYEVFLTDYRQIDKTATEIHDLDNFPVTWDAVSVKRISPNIFDWLNMQDNTRNVLIAIMIVVAVINMITCLIVLVLERVRMVGVLKALGASDWTVQKIFLRHSALITIAGIILGVVLALIILYLQEKTGFIKLKEEAYYMTEAAVKIVWWQIGAIAAGTLIVCFLVLMIPSLFVKKIQPVKAIQFR